MTRMIGCCLIAAVGALLGLRENRLCRERCYILEELITSLTLLCGELCDRAAPTLDAVLSLKDRGPMRTRAMYSALAERMSEELSRGMPELWENALNTVSVFLSGEQIRVLEPLGHVLGRGNAEEQRAALERAVRELERCRRDAGDEYSKSKLYPGIGLAAGTMAAIALM